VWRTGPATGVVEEAAIAHLLTLKDLSNGCAAPTRDAIYSSQSRRFSSPLIPKSRYTLKTRRTPAMEENNVSAQRRTQSTYPLNIASGLSSHCRTPRQPEDHFSPG
jgi:hypothetical protein